MQAPTPAHNVLLGPPWLPSQQPATSQPHATGIDVAAVVGALPRAVILDPFLARISHHAGHGARADGALIIEPQSCRKIKGERELCIGTFNETARAHGTAPVKVFVRIDSRPRTDLERAALVENAVQQRLVRLQQRSLDDTDEAVQLRRRGWTTRLTPRVSFVLLLHRNLSRGAGHAQLLGPDRPATTHQYVTVAEAAAGRQLSSAIHEPPAIFSRCAVMHAILQVALKLAVLQRLTGFVHGDLMGNNVLCAPPAAAAGAAGAMPTVMIGDCSLIDMESSTLSIAKAGMAGGSTSVAGVASTAAAGHLMLGRTLDASKAYFADADASFSSAARAFDMHMLLHWLSKQAHAAARGGGAVVEWLAAFHESACNVSRSAFAHLQRERVSGPAKYTYFGSRLHRCFWPSHVAAYILQSAELAACERPAREEPRPPPSLAQASPPHDEPARTTAAPRVAFEVVVPEAAPPLHGANWSHIESLVALTLRPIPTHGAAVSTLRRAMPREPPRDGLSEEDLRRERDETIAFLGKHLAADPRSMPEGHELSTAHMQTCTACAHARAYHAVLHGGDGESTSPIAIGSHRQPLVDDYLIASWLGVVRTLEAPSAQDVVLHADSPGDTRFGCPCSAHATGRDGSGTRLWHASRGELTLSIADEHAIVTRTSDNGWSNWSVPRQIKLSGGPERGRKFKSFIVAQPIDGAPTGATGSQEQSGNGTARATGATLFAGYEGMRSHACLAVSHDGGASFRTLSAQRAAPDARSCYDNRRSVLMRAADTYVMPALGGASMGHDLVWYRQDFGTSGTGWREIRGVQVAELDGRVAELPTRQHAAVRRVHAAWYFDRLGKLERYRRQVYALALTPYMPGLWLGLLTVLEWPKDVGAERVGDAQPRFERDTSNVYLVTSRDGVHIDDGWVYAHQPLLRKGRVQRAWNSGFLLPAAQIVTDSKQHRVYFEARKGTLHHEHRFRGEAVLGAARWPRDRIVGVTQASRAHPGELTTKPLVVNRSGARSLWVDVVNGTISAAVLDNRGAPVHSFAEEQCVVFPPAASAEEGTSALSELRWADAGSTTTQAALPPRGKTRSFGSALELYAPGEAVRLRFVLTNGAKLFSFQVF